MQSKIDYVGRKDILLKLWPSLGLVPVGEPPEAHGPVPRGGGQVVGDPGHGGRAEVEGGDGACVQKVKNVDLCVSCYTRKLKKKLQRSNHLGQNPSTVFRWSV